MRKRKEIEKAVDAFNWKFPDNVILELLLDIRELLLEEKERALIKALSAKFSS